MHIECEDCALLERRKVQASALCNFVTNCGVFVAW
jgi:hypothetical protein